MPEGRAEWLAGLPARLLAAPEHRAEFWRLGGTDGAPDAAMLSAFGSPLIPAAVLVPIINRGPDASLLFTRRAAALQRHAGQISFPGGKLDAADDDPTATALRETREEIGVLENFVRPLGYLSDHVVLTGFRITPVVALLEPGYSLQLAGGEVESVFEVPLQFALQPANFKLTRRSFRGFEFQSWELTYGEHQIWGATAGILRHLSQRLAGEST